MDLPKILPLQTEDFIIKLLSTAFWNGFLTGGFFKNYQGSP